MTSSTAFPIYFNVHAAKLNLKKLLEAVEDYTSFLARDAEDLLEDINLIVSQEQALLEVPSSQLSYELADQEPNPLLEKDVLSIFYSPEVKELGKKKPTDEEEEFEQEPEPSLAEAASATDTELERVPSPIYRVWEGFPSPTIEEHMHPDGEAEFLSTFKYRGPLCTYLDRSEIPTDLHRASKWLAHYMQMVAQLLLTKVREIETGLSIVALKERGEEDGPPQAQLLRKADSKDRSTERMLSSAVMSSSKRLRFSQTSLAAKARAESTLSGFKESVEEEEERSQTSSFGDDDDRRSGTVATRRSTVALMFGDSPFSSPKEESPEELEAFSDLLQQLDNPRVNVAKIKLKGDLSPQYLVKKCSQTVQQNNLMQLENTALEIFLTKQHVPIDLGCIEAASKLEPTWGQILSDLLVRLKIFAKDSLSASFRDTKSNTDLQSSETKQTIATLQTPVVSGSSSSQDSDTIESMTGYELCRYMYTPPTEVISFEPLTSDHFFSVKPPHYRFMPIEEAVKRADEKRDLAKRVHQMKREIVRTFSKEPESDEESDDGEESGWRKWFCYERRQDLVNMALDGLVLLNQALHQEAVKTLQELQARKRTMVLETVEKSQNAQELRNVQKIRDKPPEKRLLFQRNFSDVLYKTMKSFLASDLKTKNLMLAHQRTLTNQIIELTKTVRHIEQLEKKTDWGDLALQRLQYNSAHRRNITIDSDINELKKLNATYTLKLIHAREELDAQLRENKSLMKERDLSLKKKNSFKETFMAQHKKLVEIQDSLNDAPKISDVERFVMQARTEDYKKKKMRSYQTELEIRQANKRVQYLRNRINGLSMEPQSHARLKERHRKITQTEKFVEALRKFCDEAEKEEFGVHVVPLEPPELAVRGSGEMNKMM